MSAKEHDRVEGEGRGGAVSDRVTQHWVRLTGHKVSVAEDGWLEGPVGDVDVIGARFFAKFAERRGLAIHSSGGPRGLLADFDSLAGPACDPKAVHPLVRKFYEQTSDYDFDVWSEWCGPFRPLGRALAVIFSRRLQQMNVPLSSLDTRMGVTSQVLLIVRPDGPVMFAAWVRELRSSGDTLYAGAYSVCRVPGYGGTCVRVVFPLPNGHATVVMQPESRPDGSLLLKSAGRRYGDPGFYFFVQASEGRGWARYVGSLKETIHVYADDRGEVRADHELRIWGIRFLRLHYRVRSRAAS